MLGINLTPHISNLTSKPYAIIVAGGSGSRMRSALPKQFLLLNGKPVIMHAISAFKNCSASPEIIVVLHPDFHDYWKELCAQHNFTIAHHLVSGGQTRFHSVQNALNIIHDDEAVVAIHDSVRPLITPAVIDRSFRCATELGNAVVAVKSRDSVRQVTNAKSASLLRDEIYLVQTPQTFRLKQLKEAYQQIFDECFTDDASVIEKAGFSIKLIEGEQSNFKITFPEDLLLAEVLLKQKQLLA
jgi:2-C-methyl-D-erythritol 4-phosphate cytidylyltransferase